MRADLPTAFVSCFDKELNEDDRASFWKKIMDPKEITELENRATVMQGVLHRNRLASDRECFFTLKKGVLYYKTDVSSNEIEGIAKLNFQKIEVFQSSSGAVEKVYGIRLYTGNIQTKLLSLNRDTILEWYRRMGPMLINRDFFSKYELKDLLGEGAFSQVYKVVERKTGATFAAKVIKHKMIYSDKRGVLLMKQEIEIMRQLDHPNIIKLVEVHEVNNAIIVILEYAEGCELKKINMNLTFQDVMVVLKSLVSVASYLEQLGIVHRDLKPSNIMVINTGPSKITKNSTKIIDFGLAAFLSEKLILTKCGTPGYIAPEILNQSSRDKIVVSQNVDVYSIGIIFYEMIYKCNPFKEAVGKNDSKKVVRKNANNILSFDKPTIYKQYLDSRVLDLIKMMTSRDDKDRPFASSLLSHPIVVKGPNFWKTSDYHPEIEENAASHLVFNPYTFKVNASILPLAKKPSKNERPKQLMIDLDIIGTAEIYILEDFSPNAAGIMSPLDNRSKYKQHDFTHEEFDERSPGPDRWRTDRLASAVSLDKRFRGGRSREKDSLLIKTAEDEGEQNNFRMSFRSNSVGVPPPKSHLSSTKKNTAYETDVSHRGLFVLQKCENKGEKPSYYD